VRTIRVEGYSFELCGGTHCRASGQIGSFVITGERSIGSGMRRIEALTGAGADAYLRKRGDALERAADLIGAVSVDAIEDRIAALQDELKEAKRRLKSGGGTALPKPGDLKSQVIEIEPGFTALVFGGPFESMEHMKGYAKDLKSSVGPNFIALGLEGETPGLVVLADDVAVAHGMAAGSTASAVAHYFDGRGGGRPDIAQAQGADPAGLPTALDAIRK